MRRNNKGLGSLTFSSYSSSSLENYVAPVIDIISRDGQIRFRCLRTHVWTFFILLLLAHRKKWGKVYQRERKNRKWGKGSKEERKIRKWGKGTKEERKIRKWGKGSKEERKRMKWGKGSKEREREGSVGRVPKKREREWSEGRVAKREKEVREGYQRREKD